MKNIKLITILALSGAVAFGAKTTTHKAKVNFTKAELVQTESVNTVMAELIIDSETDVKGVQFDIQYNTSEIKSITPQNIDGFNVQHSSLARKASTERDVMRGLIFSLQGLILNENPKFAVEFVADFHGISTIEFVDIILADTDGNSIAVDIQSFDISNSSNLLPVKTELTDVYPNPFNPSSTINYGLMNDGHIEIMVYDATGRLVDELVNQHQTAGYHSITWNASSQASGMYFAKMIAGDVVQTQKLVLLK
jgi:hypothetical protein